MEKTLSLEPWAIVEISTSGFLSRRKGWTAENLRGTIDFTSKDLIIPQQALERRRYSMKETIMRLLQCLQQPNWRDYAGIIVYNNILFIGPLCFKMLFTSLMCMIRQVFHDIRGSFCLSLELCTSQKKICDMYVAVLKLDGSGLSKVRLIYRYMHLRSTSLIQDIQHLDPIESSKLQE
jgi:hypothetical protein